MSIFSKHEALKKGKNNEALKNENIKKFPVPCARCELIFCRLIWEHNRLWVVETETLVGVGRLRRPTNAFAPKSLTFAFAGFGASVTVFFKNLTIFGSFAPHDFSTYRGRGVQTTVMSACALTVEIELPQKPYYVEK